MTYVSVTDITVEDNGAERPSRRHRIASYDFLKCVWMDRIDGRRGMPAAQVGRQGVEATPWAFGTAIDPPNRNISENCGRIGLHLPGRTRGHDVSTMACLPWLCQASRGYTNIYQGCQRVREGETSLVCKFGGLKCS